MSRAAKISRGFSRLGLALACLFGLIGVCGLIVAAYSYASAPNYKGWLEVSSGNKIVLFPPETSEAAIRAAIPILDKLPEPHYGRKAIKFDPTWLAAKDTFEATSFDLNWEDTRNSVLESASNAALFGIAFFAIAGAVYVVVRTIGWILAGFFD